ncbi:MAG: RNA polymerase factor sigma-54 [Chloroflexota bacterium]
MDLELDLTIDYSTDQRQLQKVSPRLVAANYILELSSLDLQRQIEDELSDNPALERVDVPTCQTCGSELAGSVCPVCIQRQKGLDNPSDPADWYERDFVSKEYIAADDEFDPLTRVASEETVAERLLSELRPQISESDFPIAEFLVGSLDEKGYLSWTIQEIAGQLDADESRVRMVLNLLQSLEPIGVGSRNLRECLLIQLRYLAERGISQPHAEEIISDYLYELGERKFSRIAHNLKIQIDEVSAVSDFVKERLNPHPAHGFSATNLRDRDSHAMYILPDVMVSRTAEGFEVEVVESKRFALRINPIYRTLSTPPSSETPLSTEDREHIRQYVHRAKLFMANISQRRQTLHKISCEIVEQQKEFLERGIRFLQPLSRAAVAAQLGIHESTVSRATAAKYIMLPDGEIIPFSHFFTPSLGVKDVMKEIIGDEPESLTDSEIAERLASRGIHIARRTVAKYRTQLDILPSRLRS